MKLEFDTSKFIIVKQKNTELFFAIKKEDFPIGKWDGDSDEEITCTPIGKDGSLEEMFERDMSKNQLDTNVWIGVE